MTCIVHNEDCRSGLPKLMPDTVDMVLTDPPYFLDGLDDKWEKGTDGARGTGSVGGLPVGMKFDRKQGYNLQKFMEPVSDALFNCMKPGAFALVFSSPRLTHRMAVAMEDVGFEIRDLYMWRFTKRAQFKAFSLNHFVAKLNKSDSEKQQILASLDNRKTAQLRPEFEAIVCAQKPKQGTLIDNWMQYKVGLIDATQSLTQGTAPSTIMTVEKENKTLGVNHLTTKPVLLCEHLIKLFTCEGQLVVDPFLGSGTTCIAAKNTLRNGVGYEVNSDYCQVANRLLSV